MQSGSLKALDHLPKSVGVKVSSSTTTAAMTKPTKNQPSNQAAAWGQTTKPSQEVQPLLTILSSLEIDQKLVLGGQKLFLLFSKFDLQFVNGFLD